LLRLGCCCVSGNAHTRTFWGLDLRRFARLPSRVLAVAGGIVLAAIGTVTLASPASAHTAELSYQLKCGPEAGTATVVWTIRNNWRTDGTAKINRDLDGVKDGATVGSNQSVVGTEDVKLADNAKPFKLTMKWPDRVKDDHEITADWSKLDCAPRPKVEFTDKCDGSVVVKVTNTGKETVKIAVNAREPFVERKEIPGGESWEVFHARVDRAWDRVLATAAGTDGLAVVTHGLVCWSIVSRHVTRGNESPPSMRFGNTSLTLLEGPAPWRAGLVDCTAHLDAATRGDGMQA